MAQCVLFRRGLAVELEYVNHQIAHHKIQVRRFQVQGYLAHKKPLRGEQMSQQRPPRTLP